MTPVPGAAGLSRTTPRPSHPDRVRDGALDAGNPEEVLLGLLDTLGDGRGNLLGLAVTDTYRAVAVADDDQRGEAEATTTLDDLGDTVDRDNTLDVGGLLDAAAVTTVALTVAPLATAAAAGAAAAALGSCHRIDLSPFTSAVRASSSEVQPGFAGGVGQGGDAPVVLVAPAVEDDRLDAGRLGALGDQARRPSWPWPVLSPSTPAMDASRVDADASVLAREVVDHLRDDVAGGAGHDQARTHRRTGDLLADAEWRGACRRPPCRRCPCAILTLRAHDLLTSLSDLAADDLAGVPHTLGLVRVGLAQLADVRSDLADLLLVDALHVELGGRLDREGDALGGVDRDRVAVAERELQVGALGLRRGSRRRRSRASCGSPRSRR